MFFTEVATYFGWPTGDEKSLSPMVERACKRVKNQLVSEGLTDVKVLPTNPSQKDRSGSLAVVFEFENKPSEQTLQKAHAFAWNLCEGEQVIFLVKNQNSIQAWSALVPPSRWKDAILAEHCILPKSSESGNRDLLRAFHWINLADGYFQKKVPDKFKQNLRADKLLVSNLKHIRRKLTSTNSEDFVPLSIETCHNLLARLIFVQYLFQRKDEHGQSFLSEDILKKLHKNGVLNAEHTSLTTILNHKTDTYELFRWLNPKFNGDLFPKAGSASFTNEQREVKKQHLTLLADYLSGDRELENGQGLLWQHYSFETIPISFISSMYEAFLSEGNKQGDKAFYTQPHLVDFILDTALPWHSDDWDLKILDPCCGSGIFLVKAFQRLVYRWTQRNGAASPSIQDLRKILANNIVGVDIHTEAVRVACFSLYLAMADEISPRQWNSSNDQAIFPELNGNSMLNKDFFCEDHKLVSSNESGERYDLVIGNAPWGKNSVDPPIKNLDFQGKNKESLAISWAKHHRWPLSNRDIGPLFFAKALILSKKSKSVVMIQPVGLLNNEPRPAAIFRERLFESAEIVEINNFTAVRAELFANAVAACCVIYALNKEPSENNIITYLSPKTVTNSDVVIEPNDWNEIVQKKALKLPWIWTTLLWADQRHLELILKIQKQFKPASDFFKFYDGVKPGLRSMNRKYVPWLAGRKYIPPNYLEQLALELKTDLFKPILPYCERPRKEECFDMPQALVKKSWSRATKRLSGGIVQSDNGKGLICSNAYVSVRPIEVEDTDKLKTFSILVNSKFAMWYSFVTSHRASYNQELRKSEVSSIPIPDNDIQILDVAYNEIDSLTKKAFNFSDSEWVIIDDLHTYTLANFKDGDNSLGNKSTYTNSFYNDSLYLYAEWLIRVLKNGFGNIKISATVFREETESTLPIRILALHLDEIDATTIHESVIAEQAIISLIQQLHGKVIKSGKDNSGFLIENHLRYYDSYTPKGHNKAIPTLFIVKPDRKICWTRTQAMNDADEIAADILSDYTTSNIKNGSSK